jgi:hypothetical protein
VRAPRLRWPRAGAPEAMRPVEALLEVAAFPDDGIAAMSFNFWHRLARHLTTGFAPQSLDAASAAEVTRARPRLRIWQSAACRARVLLLCKACLTRPPADAPLDDRRVKAPALLQVGPHLQARPQ